MSIAISRVRCLLNWWWLWLHLFGCVDTPYFLFHFNVASIESIRVRSVIGMDRRLRLTVLLLLLLLLTDLILKFFPGKEEKVKVNEKLQSSESIVIQTEERHSRNFKHSVAKEKGEFYDGTPNHA